MNFLHPRVSPSMAIKFHMRYIQQENMYRYTNSYVTRGKEKSLINLKPNLTRIIFKIFHRNVRFESSLNSSSNETSISTISDNSLLI